MVTIFLRVVWEECRIITILGSFKARLIKGERTVVLNFIDLTYHNSMVYDMKAPCVGRLKHEIAITYHGPWSSKCP